MQQKLSHCRDEFSLLAGTFRLALSAVIQVFRLSRRTGIPACFGTSRLGSLHDVFGFFAGLQNAISDREKSPAVGGNYHFKCLAIAMNSRLVSFAFTDIHFGAI